MGREEILTKFAGQQEQIQKTFSVRRLSLFGSAARDEMADKSDVDILVEFEKKATFDAFMDLKFYLEDLLGITVDLVTDNALRPQIRKAIKGEIINVA
ncbi:MAG: nucleotidyltransferase family protein [Planctomycetes bacterium]|nr:nucleotidyltransferase family protein [Planctomycetota bacterium]